jgi:hypothetical protein
LNILKIEKRNHDRFTFTFYEEVMRCWIDFKEDQGIPADLVQIDDGSGWFLRRKKVKIYKSKKRAHTLVISLKSSEQN